MHDRIQHDGQLDALRAEAGRGGGALRGGPQSAARSSKADRRTGARQPDFGQRLYPVQKLAAAVGALAEEGVPASEVLAGSGLTPADFSSVSTRISYRQMIVVYNNAIRLSKDPALGFRSSRRLHVTSYGMYGYALLSCQNFAQAAEFGAKYAMAVGPAFDFRFSLDAEWARYRFLPVISQDPGSDLYRYALEGTLGAFLVQAYDLYEQPPVPACLRIVYSPPAHASLYSELFGCPVFFDSEINEIVLPAAASATPIACGNPANLELARRACEDILKEIEASGGFAALVREALLRLPGHFPTAETIATDLGVSPRQMHRNLVAEHTSYRKIHDEARMGLAIAYLQKTHMTTEDVATRLGFSDGANFRHAFRRWTGKSTSEFRAGDK